MTNIKQKVISANCRTCDYIAEMIITDEQLKKYENGELIQNAFPHVSPDDRELLISGFCGTCFDNMFA